MERLLGFVDATNDFLWSYVVVALLVVCAVYFTVRSRGVQFTLLSDMLKIVVDKPIFKHLSPHAKRSEQAAENELKKIGSFQAFTVSL